MKHYTSDICVNCLHMNDRLFVSGRSLNIDRFVVERDDELYRCSIYRDLRSPVDSCGYITNIMDLTLPVHINVIQN